MPTIIESLRSRGHLSPLPPRLKAWDPARPVLEQQVTADELRQSYKSLCQASVGHDPELTDFRRSDFHAKLRNFLNQ